MPLAVAVGSERHLLLFELRNNVDQGFELIDINAENGTSRLVSGFAGRPGPYSVLLHADKRLYIAAAGQLGAYDFASGAIEMLGRSATTEAQALLETSDGALYLIGRQGDAFERFDPATKTFSTLSGTEEIALPTDMSRMNAVSDGGLAYFAAGPYGNQLIAYDLSSGAVAATFDAGEDSRVTIDRALDGRVYSLVRNQDGVAWYEVREGQLAAVDVLPALEPLDARARVMRDAGAAAGLLGLKFELDGPTPEGVLTTRYNLDAGSPKETTISLHADEPVFEQNLKSTAKFAVAVPTVFYVSTSGNDGNPGTQSAPFKTLNKGVSVLKPGNTLLVMPGTYPESLYNVIPSGSGATAQVVIKAADPNNRPILKPTSGMRVLQLEFAGSKPLQYVTIDGFVIDGANVISDAVKITTGANHITLMNSEVRNAPNNGIITTNNASQYNTFLNLDVHHNGYKFNGHGFYISSSNNVIERSKAHDNSAWGIHVYADSYTISNNTVHRNEAYNNGRVLTRGVGIGLYSGNNHVACDNIVWGNPGGGIAVNYGASANKVYHNTVYKNGSNPGITIGQNASGTQVINNVVTSNGGHGIWHLSTANGTQITKNLVYGNGGSNVKDDTGKAAISGTVTADPQYQDPVACNLRVKATSPAIDAGSTLTAVAEDADGIRRPQGAAHDIGAFENTPVADITAPVISAVTVASVTTNSAVVTWTTNEPADTQVEYGTTTAYGTSTTLNTAKVTQHSVTLTNLASLTTYQFRVKSRDAASNLAVSGNQSLTTTTTADTTAPVISAVSASSITTNSAVITWTTNEPADTQVEYGTTTAYGTSTTLNTAKVTQHSVTLSNLSAGTTYQYRVKSKDAASNLAVSTNRSLTTSTAPPPPPPPPPPPTPTGTFYVSTTGSDSNPGTQNAPFRTLNKAVARLKPGNVLLVMPGTYAESLYNVIPSGTGPTSQVVIRAADPNNRPLIKPASGARVLQLEFYGGKPLQYVTIDGFVLDGDNVSSDCVKLTSGAHHITLMNSEVRNAPNNGVITTNNATQYNTFVNLDVHHNGYSFDGHGFYISSSNNVIERCKAHDNSAWGIHVYSETYLISNNTVHRNLAYNNGRVLTRGVGIGLYSGDNHVACDNVVWGNPAGGIAVNYRATNNKVYNNTVHNNGTNAGIIIGQGSSGTLVINNIVTSNASYGIWNLSSSTATQIVNNLAYGNNSGNLKDDTAKAVKSGTLTVDPQYQDAAGLNFRLRATSPAIDMGSVLTAVAEDADGVSRPQGSSHDIGAFENVK
jgi:parallel beta-helix repeat protein